MQARPSPRLLQLKADINPAFNPLMFVSPCIFRLQSIQYITSVPDMACWISISFKHEIHPCRLSVE